MLGILTGTFLVPVNSTMIAVGLPVIAGDLQVSIPQITWVVTIYLIIMAVAQPIAGKLGDMYGNKKVMMIGFLLFLVSSIACAFSYNILSLIIFRSLQALGGALATPNATAIIRHVMPKEKLSNVFGIFGLSMGLGAAIGPLVGAGLIGWLGWQAIFWVNVPFLLFSIILTWTLVPSVNVEKKHALDVLGSLYLGVMLTLITLFVTNPEYVSVWTILLLLGSIALFIFQERRTKSPVIEFALFKNIGFSSSNVSIFINNFVMYSTVLFIPIILVMYDYPIGSVGLLLFAFSLAMSLSSLFGGKLANRYGKEKIIALSFFLLCMSVLLYFGFGEQASSLYMTIVLILGGASAGMGVASMQAANLESVPKEKSGAASGIYSTFRYMGGMMASASVSLLAGSSLLYVLLLVFSVLGLIMSGVLTVRSRNKGEGSFAEGA
nr:MFS transporter [Halalkalibacter alkaliphilus]